MSGNGVRVHREGPIGVVTLARPARRNAFDSAMAEALGEALTDLGASDAAVVLVRAEGPAFCAGWDLTELAGLRGAPPERLTALFARNVEVLRAFTTVEQPTVVAAHGAVAGFGLSLLARADVALAAADTRLALPEIAHGIVPALVMLDLIGLPHPRLALEWLLSGAPFSAEQAAAAGLVTRVVADDALAAEASALAATLAGHDRSALLATKGAYRRVRALPTRDAEAAAIAAAVDALAVSH